MSLKAAIIVGIVGATMGVVLNLLPITGIRSVLDFVYGNPLGRVTLAIPSLCYLLFFVTLLVKQK